MDNKYISKAVVNRLPRYYRYLGDLLADGVERISSNELSERMSVTASQIRQDLNNFGGFGQQGYGYNVQYLYDEISAILGLDVTHNMIIVGAGNLGQALAKYMNFEHRGFRLVGLFDQNPELIGKEVRGIKIMSMEELPEFLKENKVDIATLTIPKTSVESVADVLVENGIRALWNYAHTDLNLRYTKNVVVENVHLSESLMRLSYNLASQGR